MKILVIYHSPCIDGTASAWVFKHFSVKLGWPKTEIEYYPTNYDQDPPDISDYYNVYIVDFSYPENIILSMKKSIKGKLIILDHHKTAFENLKNINEPNLEIIIDMKRSGAQITWDFISENKKRPWFIDYIGDRDLWNFEMPFSREINKALLIGLPEGTGYLDINKMSKLLLMKPESFKEAGLYYLKMEKNMLSSILPKAIKKSFLDYKVWIIESSILISEIGDALNKNKECDFVIIWRYDYKTNKYAYSIRGGENSPDLSLIAKKFGGGGHSKAAAFNDKNLFN